MTAGQTSLTNGKLHLAKPNFTKNPLSLGQRLIQQRKTARLHILKFGSSIIFKCVDDDGIGRVSVKQKNTDVITDEEIKGSPTETMISHVLPAHGGKVCLEVNVKDIFGAEKSQEVWLQVTGADPSVKTSVTPEYYTSATNVMEGTPTQITIKGVCEGSAPFTIEILDAIEILKTEDGKTEEIQKYSSIEIKDEVKVIL